jgi:amidohydrolase
MSRRPPVPDLLAEDLISWRRHLHRHPEQGNEESETAAYIAAQLDRLQIPRRTRVAGHGILALLEGGSDGPAVMLRADMDALPIAEENDTDYTSTRPGLMHACGHDAHMACLLGAIVMLRDGTVPAGHGRFLALFQPAEEITPGGAARVLESGILDEERVGAVLAQHVDHTLEVGRLAMRSGAMMAETDDFEIEFQGPGGHASERATRPDPLQAAARFAASADRVVADIRRGGGDIGKGSPDARRALCHVGRIEAGTAANVIASSARVEGTIRTFHDGTARDLRAALEELASRSATEAGLTASVHWREGAPPTVNDDELTEVCRTAWISHLGESAVERAAEPSLAGEDFGHFSRRYPAAYWRLGIRGPRLGGEPWHSSRFDIDERALAIGAWAMATAGAAVAEKLADR